MHTDDARMQKAQQGDKHAFEELVLAHHIGAIRFAAGIVRQAETAEDIVQDCFVKLYIEREKYRMGGSFKALLHAMVRSRCIDHLRRQKQRTLLSQEDPAYVEAPDTGRMPEELLQGSERLSALYAAMDLLPMPRWLRLPFYTGISTVNSADRKR